MASLQHTTCVRLLYNICHICLGRKRDTRGKNGKRKDGKERKSRTRLEIALLLEGKGEGWGGCTQDAKVPLPRLVPACTASQLLEKRSCTTSALLSALTKFFFDIGFRCRVSESFSQLKPMLTCNAIDDVQEHQGHLLHTSGNVVVA